MTEAKANEILTYVAQEILSPMARDSRPAKEVWSGLTGNQFHALAGIVWEGVSNKQYKRLVGYAHILKDDSFDFPSEGIHVRMQVFTYEYENGNTSKYLAICRNDECVYIEELK